MSYRGVSGRKGRVKMVNRANTFWKAMGKRHTT